MQNLRKKVSSCKRFWKLQKSGLSVEAAKENLVPVPFDSAICFSGQGQFHPLRYINALLSEFIKLGGVLLPDTMINENSFENQVYTLATIKGPIRAKKLIYATHIPPGLGLMNFRNAPYRSYVLGVRLKNQNYPEGLAYDMQEPYHYFRTQEIDGQPYLIVGGQDHKTGHGDPEQAFKSLEDYVRQYYELESVDYRWSSQYYVPVDGLPYIGQFPGADKGTYMATGFNGNGMMFGTLSAKIICDLILEKENPYAHLFDPSRSKPVAGFKEFVKENADVAWHFFADRLSPVQLKSLADLKSGEGKLVDFDGKKLAVYKDELGKVTALNPRCTHAGCIVQFNAAEISWDCPCHGGRFDISGKVITGPPTIDLETLIVSYDLPS
ncbi:FAD-dependent oxidoreductase [Pedobacter gandavensis]|uniref:FAD-dependent oxidoreductase n=1 Tax=Pedobacter gandavensis TaxID=2679963 RepID=UPI00247980A7|nr:FAD-dependent oxidoreductase [Pedobacter gandavensis]WGQ10664.1 FAD-dependent oxidoreductase [Pedobacter gandavensis]